MKIEDYDFVIKAVKHDTNQYVITNPWIKTYLRNRIDEMYIKSISNLSWWDGTLYLRGHTEYDVTYCKTYCNNHTFHEWLDNVKKSNIRYKYLIIYEK